MKTITEKIVYLESIAAGECDMPDGPPFCDDGGKACNVCIARGALNSINDDIDFAIREIEG